MDVTTSNGERSVESDLVRVAKTAQALLAACGSEETVNVVVTKDWFSVSVTPAKC